MPSSNSPFKVFGTGLDASGHRLADGAADPHYALISGPSTAAPVVLPQGGFPFPYWTADDANSAFITPGDALANANNGYQEPGGVYDYQTKFDLTGYDSATAAIHGLIGADNRVMEVRLNGVDVAGYTPTAEGGSDFASLRSLDVTSGFQAGMNTLDFVVENYAGDSFNPTGFRAQLSGTAQLTGTTFGLFGTGVDNSGAPLADGASDPHWQLTSAPEPTNGGVPYVTIQNGYPFPYWAADGPNSKWISPNANENDYAGGATDAVGYYTYQATFDVTGFDPSTARIAGLVSADNTLEQVLLNGQDVGYMPDASGADYTGLHSLVIDSGFISGVNTLDFVVYNAPQPDPSNNAHNPSAFRAELTGTAAPLPHADDDGYSVLHDSTLSVPAGGVLTNDTPPSGQTLSAVRVTSPLHGTLNLLGDGSFVYTPNALYAGTDSFTYYATDGTENSNVATVTLLVTDQAPVALAASYSGLHDQVLTVDASSGVLADDTDPDGDTLTAGAASPPTHGTLSFHADGSFTYTPNAGYVGPDSFTYTASDGILTSGPTTVSLLVTDNAPTAAAHAYAAQENGTLTIAGPGVLAGATDADGDPLTAGAVSQPQYGSLTLNPDGSFTYTPNAGYVGPDSFTYQVSDGALTAGAVVSLSVNAVNAPPTAVDDAYTMLHDQTLTVAAAGVLANDDGPDGNPLQAGLTAQAAHGTAALNADGSFTYTPNAGYVGTDSFQYAASDGLAASAPATVTITVTDPNAPVAVDDAYAVGRNGTLTLASDSGVLANDSDADPGDTLTAVTVGAGAAHGTLTLNPDGSFTYTPTAGYVGTDTFQYQASDGVLTSNVATVTITVTDSAPVAVNDAYGVLHDTTLIIPASGLLANDTDADGDPLTAAVATLPQYGSLTPNADGSFTYVPDAGYVGPDSFTYTASDGVLTSAPATVAINVKATNTPPAAVDQGYTTAHDTTLIVDAATGLLTGATDADGDPLLAAVLTGPAHGTLAPHPDGSFQYTPDAGYFGSDGFTFAAFDGTADSAPATATLTVTAAAPTAADDAYSVLPTGPTAVNVYDGVLANDSPSDGSLTAVLETQPADGVLTWAGDGSFVYTPGANFTGTDSFTYEAFDGLQHSAPASVTLTTAPVAQPLFYQTAHDAALTVTADEGVLSGASDADLGPMTAVKVSDPAHGSVTLNADGSFVYTPNAGYVGDDSFTYAAQEGLVQSNTATVTVSVTDQAPDAGDDWFQVHAGDTLNANQPGLSEVATDPDLDPLTFRLGAGPSHGRLTFRADGTFVYQPDARFVGTDSFTYRVFDGALYSPSYGTVTINVEDLQPTAAPASFDVAADSVFTTDAAQSLLNDSFQPEGDPLTAVLIAGPQDAAAPPGSFALHPNGTFTYTPLLGFTGLDAFTYAVTDGILASAAVTVALKVNAAPVANDDAYYLFLGANGALTVTAADGVLANDFNPGAGNPNAPPLTAQLVRNVDPGVGFVSLNADGSFTFTPNPNNPPPSGPITFGYQDLLAGVVVGAATVTLTPVTPLPTVDLKESDFYEPLPITADAGNVQYEGRYLPSAGAAAPVAYVEGQTVTIKAQFTTDLPALFAGRPVTVVGVPSDADIPDIVGTATADGATLTLDDAAHDGKGVNVVLPNQVQAVDDLAISWYVLPPGGSLLSGFPYLGGPLGDWVAAGTSHYELYLTYKAPPKGMTLYQTVLDVGTRAAAGQTTALGVTQAVMGAFSTLNMKEANNGPVMTYWNDWKQSNKRTTTQLLLLNHDGNCVGWTQFFLDTLEAQGVSGGLLDKIQSAGNNLTEGLVVAQWDHGAANNTDPATNKPGQYPYVDILSNAGAIFVQAGGKWGYGWDAAKSSVLFNTDPKKYLNAQGESARAQPPLALFDNHVIAEITITDENGKKTTLLFDPSYGKEYTLPKPLVLLNPKNPALALANPVTALDAAIPYFFTRDPTDPTGTRYLFRPNPKGILLLTAQFNYAARQLLP